MSKSWGLSNVPEENDVTSCLFFSTTASHQNGKGGHLENNVFDMVNAHFAKVTTKAIEMIFFRVVSLTPSLFTKLDAFCTCTCGRYSTHVALCDSFGCCFAYHFTDHKYHTRVELYRLTITRPELCIYRALCLVSSCPTSPHFILYHFVATKTKETLPMDTWDHRVLVKERFGLNSHTVGT